jgi:hypothetical protein
VLRAPRFVPVFFANDQDADAIHQLTDFDQRIGATSYWVATTSEYGVGAATATAAVMLAENAPAAIDDAAIQAWLAGKLNSDDPAWPTPDDTTVYVLHYPVDTVVTLTTITLPNAMGPQQSCIGFAAYHDMIALDAAHGGRNVPMAVMPRCTAVGPLIGLQAATGAESHELIEAATDPYWRVNPAYWTTDDMHHFWSLALGGEVGDLCALNPDAFIKLPGTVYEVQRTWSNQAILAGHDPCVPQLLSQAYVNAAPVLNDDVTISTGGQTITMKGVKILVGQTKTIDVDLFSDAPTGGPWSVAVADYAAAVLGAPQLLSLSLDRTTGQNGDRLRLTITPVAAGPNNMSIFVLSSSLGTQFNTWYGLVGN